MTPPPIADHVCPSGAFPKTWFTALTARGARGLQEDGLEYEGPGQNGCQESMPPGGGEGRLSGVIVGVEMYCTNYESLTREGRRGVLGSTTPGDNGPGRIHLLDSRTDPVARAARKWAGVDTRQI